MSTGLGSTCTFASEGFLLMKVVNSSNGQPAGSLPFQVEALYPSCLTSPAHAEELGTVDTNASGFLSLSGSYDWYYLTMSQGSQSYDVNASISAGSLTCVTLGIPSGTLNMTQQCNMADYFSQKTSSNGSSTIQSNVTNGLQLTATIKSAVPEPGNNISVTAQVYDTLSTPIVVNATSMDNPADGPCQQGLATGVEVYQGSYTSANLSSAKQLLLYNPALIYTCPEVFTFQYTFSANSDGATVQPSDGLKSTTGPVNETSVLQGYWTGSGQNYTFHTFSQGTYTVVVFDAWNQSAIGYFQVGPAIASPIEMVSVTGSIPPYNPGGPMVGVTLKNVGTSTITSLNATLGLENLENGVHGYSFVFYVSPSYLLVPGQTIEEMHALIGAGFDTGVYYPLTINGTLVNGTQFSYTVPVQVVPPTVSAGTTTSVSSTTSGDTTQTRATVTDSIDSMELRLSLNTSSSSGGISISVFADEYNPLVSMNNVTAANDWFVPLNYLDGAICGDDGPTVGFAIAQGHYTSSNATAAKFLDLVNPVGATYHCPLYLGYASATGFLFQPMSDMAASYGCNPGTSECLSGSASTGASGTGAITGYWNQGGAFMSFPRGVYTVLVEDEWGNSVLAYFTVP